MKHPLSHNKTSVKAIVWMIILTHLFWSQVLLAQGLGSVALVSNVTGKATLYHEGQTYLPEDARFKGPVVLGDRIQTGAQSMVAMLVGNDALVSLKEFSEMRVTEEPGFDQVIHVTTGQVCIATKRDGAPIKLEVPGATVTVNPGSMASIQVGGSDARQGPTQTADAPDYIHKTALGQPETLINDSDRGTGKITVQLKEGSASLVSHIVGKAPVLLAAKQGVEVVGGIISPPFESKALYCQVQDLQDDPQHTAIPEEMKDEIKNGQQTQATQLVKLLSEPAASQTETPTSVTTGTDEVPIIPTIDISGNNEIPTANPGDPLIQVGNSLIDITTPFLLASPSQSTLDGPPFQLNLTGFSGSTSEINPAQALEGFSPQVASQLLAAFRNPNNPDALLAGLRVQSSTTGGPATVFGGLRLLNSQVQAPTEFIQIGQTGNSQITEVELSGALLNLENSTFSAENTLIALRNGQLDARASSQPLVQISGQNSNLTLLDGASFLTTNPSMLMSPSGVLSLTNGATSTIADALIDLDGSMLDATGGQQALVTVTNGSQLTVGGNLISAKNGSSLIAPGGVLSLNGGQANIQDDFMALNASDVQISNGAITATNNSEINIDGYLFALSNGNSVTTTGSPLLTLASSTFKAGGLFKVTNQDVPTTLLSSLVDADATSTVTLTEAVVKVENTPGVTLASLNPLLGFTAPVALLAEDSAVTVSDYLATNTAASLPLVRLLGSDLAALGLLKVTTPGALSAGLLANLVDADAASTVTLTEAVVKVEGTNVRILGGLPTKQQGAPFGLLAEDSAVEVTLMTPDTAGVIDDVRLVGSTLTALVQWEFNSSFVNRAIDLNELETYNPFGTNVVEEGTSEVVTNISGVELSGSQGIRLLGVQNFLVGNLVNITKVDVADASTVTLGVGDLIAADTTAVQTFEQVQARGGSAVTIPGYVAAVANGGTVTLTQAPIELKDSTLTAHGLLRVSGQTTLPTSLFDQLVKADATSTVALSEAVVKLENSQVTFVDTLPARQLRAPLGLLAETSTIQLFTDDETVFLNDLQLIGSQLFVHGNGDGVWKITKPRLANLQNPDAADTTGFPTITLGNNVLQDSTSLIQAVASGPILVHVLNTGAGVVELVSVSEFLQDKLPDILGLEVENSTVRLNDADNSSEGLIEANGTAVKVINQIEVREGSTVQVPGYIAAVSNGGTLSVNQPPIALEDSTLTAQGFLKVGSNISVSVNGISQFISLDDTSSVNIQNSLVRVEGGSTLTSLGTFVDDASIDVSKLSLTNTNPLLLVDGGSTSNINGHLVSLNTQSLNTPGGVFTINASDVTVAEEVLAILSANAALTGGDTPLVSVVNGSTLESGGRFLNLQSGGQVTAPGGVLLVEEHVINRTDQLLFLIGPNTTLTGGLTPLVSVLNGSILDVGRDATNGFGRFLDIQSGSQVTAPGGVLTVREGSAVHVTDEVLFLIDVNASLTGGNVPLVSVVDGGTLESGGRFLDLQSGGQVTTPGGLLLVEEQVVNRNDQLLFLIDPNTTLTGGTTPLVSVLNGSSLDVGRDATDGFGRFLDIQSGSQVTAPGGVLTVREGGAVHVTDEVLFLIDANASLTGGNVPLVSVVDGGMLESGGRFLDLQSGGKITAPGGLLTVNASGVTVDNGFLNLFADDVTLVGKAVPLVSVLNGGDLDVGHNAALTFGQFSSIQSGSLLEAPGGILNINASTVRVSDILISVSEVMRGSTILPGNADLIGGNAPLVSVLNGSTLEIGRDTERISGHLLLVGGENAHVEAPGGVLTVNASSVLITNELDTFGLQGIGVGGTVIGGPNPLISVLNGSTLEIGDQATNTGELLRISSSGQVTAPGGVLTVDGSRVSVPGDVLRIFHNTRQPGPTSLTGGNLPLVSILNGARLDARGNLLDSSFLDVEEKFIRSNGYLAQIAQNSSLILGGKPVELISSNLALGGLFQFSAHTENNLIPRGPWIFINPNENSESSVTFTNALVRIDQQSDLDWTSLFGNNEGDNGHPTFFELVTNDFSKITTNGPLFHIDDSTVELSVFQFPNGTTNIPGGILRASGGATIPVETDFIRLVAGQTASGGKAPVIDITQESVLTIKGDFLSLDGASLSSTSTLVSANNGMLELIGGMDSEQELINQRLIALNENIESDSEGPRATPSMLTINEGGVLSLNNESNAEIQGPLISIGSRGVTDGLGARLSASTTLVEVNQESSLRVFSPSATPSLLTLLDTSLLTRLFPTDDDLPQTFTSPKNSVDVSEGGLLRVTQTSTVDLSRLVNDKTPFQGVVLTIFGSGKVTTSDTLVQISDHSTLDAGALISSTLFFSPTIDVELSGILSPSITSTSGGILSLSGESTATFGIGVLQIGSKIDLGATAIASDDSNIQAVGGFVLRALQGRDLLIPSQLTISNGGLLSLKNNSDARFLGNGNLVTLDGSILSATNTLISVDASFLDIEKSAFILESSSRQIGENGLELLPATVKISDGGFLHILNSRGSLVDGFPGVRIEGNVLSVNQESEFLENDTTTIESHNTLVTVDDSTLTVGNTVFDVRNATGFTDDGGNLLEGVRVTNGGVLTLSNGSQFGGGVDGKLLNATSPLLVMLNSTMATGLGFLDVNGGSTLTADIPRDAFVSLDASALTIRNGSLINVAGKESSLFINGPLVSLANNSALNIQSGALVSVSAGGAFSLFGPIASFAGGGNTLQLNNNACSSGGCSVHPDFPSVRIAGPVNFTELPGFNALPGFNSKGGDKFLVGKDTATFINDGGTLNLPFGLSSE